MAVADEQLLIYYGLKCVPPTPSEVHACCRKGEEEYQFSQTGQRGGMVASPTISASEIVPEAAQGHFQDWG